MAAPRYYYHVTQSEELPVQVALIPSVGPNIGWDEPQIPRICVGPTPVHCLTALGGCISTTKTIRIFRTVERVLVQRPEHVSDARLTKERWLLNPTEFVLVTEVRPENLPDKLFCTSTGGDISKGQEELKKELRSYKKTLMPEGVRV